MDRTIMNEIQKKEIREQKLADQNDPETAKNMNE